MIPPVTLSEPVIVVSPFRSEDPLTAIEPVTSNEPVICAEPVYGNTTTFSAQLAVPHRLPLKDADTTDAVTEVVTDRELSDASEPLAISFFHAGIVFYFLSGLSVMIIE